MATTIFEKPSAAVASEKADLVASATSGNIAALDANGNLTDSGKTLGKSVPSDAVFTDTTYSAATQSVAGLMSATDKTKLDGVATGATANVGTITGITMNGASKGTSGVVDLGTVITSHQDISGKLDINQGSGNAGKYMKVGSNGTVSPAELVIPATSTALSLTATSAGWSNATPPTQTITATGVTATNNIAVGEGASMTSAQRTAMQSAQLSCTAQGANSITLTCYGTKPTIDLPITVVVFG